MRKLLVILAATAVGVAAMQRPAEATAITDLTGSTTLTSGDKVFSDFTCSFTGTNVLGGCGSVDVTTGIDQFGNFGILLQLNALALSDGSTTSFGDYTITYNVTSLLGATITDIHMTFNGSVTGGGVTDITEQVSNGGTIVGQIAVTNPPLNLEEAADVTGGPYATLHVLKDIQFGVLLGQAGQASISNVGQFISQIPEPATMALFGLAAVGATMRRRRLSASA